MARDVIVAARLDVLQRPLEAVVGERLDLAAVVADEMVVVLRRVAHSLEARHTVAEVEPLHESLLGQHLEHPVHARESDRLPARPQLAMDLLRAGTAVLAVEVLDHADACEAAPVARGPKLFESTL